MAETLVLLHGLIVLTRGRVMFSRFPARVEEAAVSAAGILAYEPDRLIIIEKVS